MKEEFSWTLKKGGGCNRQTRSPFDLCVCGGWQCPWPQVWPRLPRWPSALSAYLGWGPSGTTMSLFPVLTLPGPLYVNRSEYHNIISHIYYWSECWLLSVVAKHKHTYLPTRQDLHSTPCTSSYCSLMLDRQVSVWHKRNVLWLEGLSSENREPAVTCKLHLSFFPFYHVAVSS